MVNAVLPSKCLLSLGPTLCFSSVRDASESQLNLHTGDLGAWDPTFPPGLASSSIFIRSDSLPWKKKFTSRPTNPGAAYPSLSCTLR